MSEIAINIAEIVENKPEFILVWAATVYENKTLDEDQKETSRVIDAWAKEIGDRGTDPDCELAAFIRKSIEPVVNETEDEMLGNLFDSGSIGEFDEKVYEKWTDQLEAYEAVKGGNVPKSFLDVKNLMPDWKHAQVETELRYVDLRKNGYKTVARLVNYAEKSLRRKRFADLYKMLDNAITVGSPNRVTVAGGKVTEAAMDNVQLYLFDKMEDGDYPTVVGTSALMLPVMKQLGRSSWSSDDMKDSLNRYGVLLKYNGMNLVAVPGTKTANGKLPVIPANKVFAFVGKIGEADTKGNVRVYQTFDHNEEVIHLKITGYEYGFAVLNPDKIYIMDITD